MGKKVKSKSKKWVVTSVSEDGYVSVYGPYTRKKAEKIAARAAEDDTGQKTYAEARKPEKYETPED